ncbi:MAG: hypothetical protein FJX72_20510, partial [Armatimonadetes bacterium]|nr:hypothetical protein [Armatimonadota bacterium]
MTRAYAAVAVLVLGILSPWFEVIPGLPVLRGEDIVLVLFLLVYRPFDERATPPTPESRRVGRAFAAMGILALVSIAASPLLYGTDVILNDFMILPMLFRYYLIFCVGRSLAGPAAREVYWRAAWPAFVLCAGVGILQQFDLFGATERLAPWYGTPSMYGTESGVLEGRTGGTHGDPRYFGFLLCYGVAVALPRVLLWPKPRMRLAAGAVLLVLLVAVLGTLSRTTVYTCAGLILVGLLVRYRTNFGPVAMGLLLSVGAVTLILGQYRAVSEDRADAFMDRVFRRDTESYQHSQGARIRDTLKPLNEALDDPAIFVVGRGPAKSAMRTDSHNDYGWYFHRFGLMGLGFYLLLLYWGLRLGYRRFVRTTDPLDQSIAMTGVLAVVTWAMFAMAESLWKDPQIMTVTMFLYGMLHAPAI